MRWSEKQLTEHLDRTGVRAQSPRVDVSRPPFKPPGNQAGLFALGRLKTGAMNKTEAAYAAHLEAIKGTVIAWYRFEGMKLRLADNTFYTPDFAVLLLDGFMEMHEVKGFWQDDARAKIKIAADMYPFRFIAVTAEAKKRGGGWKVEDFST
jgi:hypothetical protein